MSVNQRYLVNQCILVIRIANAANTQKDRGKQHATRQTRSALGGLIKKIFKPALTNFNDILRYGELNATHKRRYAIRL